MKKLGFIVPIVSLICICGLEIFQVDSRKIWVLILSVLSLVSLVFLYRSILLPQATVMRGLMLIESQDFNNRLRKVGQREADKIVILFNRMIDCLRHERVRNREQDSFLRLLIDASPMGVVMLDLDGRVSMVNGSFIKITGLRGENDALGKSMDEIPSELAVKMAEVPLGESDIIRRGDVRMYRCYHLSFIRSGFSSQFYLLETLTEEVMRAERSAYEKVIRIMSHEVNNTMSGVMSVLDTLGENTDDEDVKEVIDSCENRCEMMCDFIRSYSDVVKLPEPVIKRVDLNRELKEMIPFLRLMVREGIELEFRESDFPVEIGADMSLLQQVIVNILKNAVESISDKGWVRIELSKGVEGVGLDICNNGESISEEVAQQLFSPFFTTKKEGRGIGLTLIREVLNRHGAKFSLKSEEGITRFRIRFNRV